VVCLLASIVATEIEIKEIDPARIGAAPPANDERRQRIHRQIESLMREAEKVNAPPDIVKNPAE
jgi:hypothetical protein